MYYEATACNVEDDITEVLQIFSNVLSCCLKFRDRQGFTHYITFDSHIKLLLLLTFLSLIPFMNTSVALHMIILPFIKEQHLRSGIRFLCLELKLLSIGDRCGISKNNQIRRSQEGRHETAYKAER